MLRTDPFTLQARIADIEADIAVKGLSALVVFGNGSALGAASRTHG